VDKQIRIAIVGLPGLRDALRQTAERLMPRMLKSGDIEYDIVVPHGTAKDAAEKIFSLQPDIVLLGHPQKEVSSWAIVEEFRQYQGCPMILIQPSDYIGTNTEQKPTDCLVFMEGDLGGICKGIEDKLLPHKTKSTAGK
jgi:hypothetical protein